MLQPEPRRDRDASLRDVGHVMDIDLELEPGPGARTEARIPLAHREPADVRHGEASSSSGDLAVRPGVPELASPTVSYRTDEVDQVMLLGRKPIKSGSQSVTAVAPTTYNKPVGNVINHAHSVSTGLPEAQMMLSLSRLMIILDLSEFDLIVNSNSCIRAWPMVASTMSRVFEFWQWF